MLQKNFKKKIEEWKKKKKIGSVVVVEMKFGWLVVCYNSQRSKSGIYGSLLNWPRQMLPASGARIII
jgi:hypothetical protein